MSAAYFIYILTKKAKITKTTTAKYLKHEYLILNSMNGWMFDKLYLNFLSAQNGQRCRISRCSR